MDYLALFLTSKFLKVKIKSVKIVIAAILGALYSVATVVLYFESLTVTLLFGLLICFAAFGKQKIRSLLYFFTVYIAVNFLLGGGMTAVFSLFNTAIGERLINMYGTVVSVPQSLPVNVFAVGLFIISGLTYAFYKIFSKKGVARRIYASITVSGITETLCLLEDSGNNLCEPISSEPVIFLSESAMSKFFDKKTLSGLKNFNTEELVRYKLKIRLAVYETVSGKEMCACVKPDKISAFGKELRGWIACGKSTSFGGYDGIIPSVIFDV